MKKLLTTLALILFSTTVMAQKPDWISLSVIIEQAANESADEPINKIYLLQRCAAQHLAMSTIIKESSPDLAIQFTESTSELAKRAALERINLAQTRANSTLDVEDISNDILQVITLLYDQYMGWANNNYLMDGAYFERDEDFKLEIALCGEIANSLTL